MSETPDELRAQAEDLRDHFTGDHCNCMSAEEAADVIDALLARLATAEAIIDKAKAVAHVEGLFQGGFEPPVDLVLAEMIREAVAQREQP